MRERGSGCEIDREISGESMRKRGSGFEIDREIEGERA